ncbi:hypothetical protein K501DRAFT_236797 [Backusella circina FSU 941]|nr:hypothetical protein K501DRAFT_236797 [Backusella circina FSU 941]
MTDPNDDDVDHKSSGIKPISDATTQSTTQDSTKKPLVFMEPNSDLSTNFSWKSGKKLEKTPSSVIYNPLTSYINSYILIVEEQPKQCRVSGSCDKDRRPIDPAPILKLIVLDEVDNILKDPIDTIFYVVHVSLWSADMSTKIDSVGTSQIPETRALVGSVVCSCSTLKDLNNEDGYYFAFPDLSVRITGEFRLQFSFIHIERSNVLTHVFSEPFIVHSAKSYPGIRESSHLSKHLARQGLKLTIRTHVRSKKPSEPSKYA